MSDAVKVGFVPFSAASRGVLVVFCDEGLKFGTATRKTLGSAADTVKRAAAANQFKGKSGAALDILAPEGIKAQRLIVIGLGNGLLLPTSIAGAVSIRPQVAGTASGMTGFIQMGIGAVAAQLSGHVIGHASDAMPMLWLMLAFGLALAVAFLALVPQRRKF